MSVVEQYREQLRRFQPVEYAGLTFHPLLVSDYALFRFAQLTWELMVSSLPPKIARLNWCAALSALDEKAKSENIKTAYLDTALYVLAKVLKLQGISTSDGKMNYPLKPFWKDGVLEGIAILTDSAIILNMRQMDVVRQIVAAQNGYTIPDENFNPELVRAAKEHEKQQKSNLKLDTDDLIASVASALNRRSAELWDWPIAEFEAARAAITRRLNYQIYTSASIGGFVTFKNGNPCPSWEFASLGELPDGFKDISELSNKEADQLLHTPNITQGVN